MQAFRTPVKLLDYPFELSYADSLLSIGSCFAQQLAQRLQHLKFRVLDNPFGVLYHPQAMAHALHRLLSEESYQETDLFEHQGRWSHFDFHGAYSGLSLQESLEKMNASREEASAVLAEASLLVFTLGTAYGWWHKKEQRIVANCHKLPGQHFERRLISVAEMSEDLVEAVQAVRAVNPQVRCLFTVSPIRHIRGGLVENQLSKASLRLLAHHLCSRLPDTHYFPSYELMMDDLRDYRFYARDMIHPSAEALDYIWGHFQQTFFSPDTQELVQQIERINRSLAHRPHFPEAAAHQQFRQQLIQQMEAIEQKHRFISFLSEKEQLLS